MQYHSSTRFLRSKLNRFNALLILLASCGFATAAGQINPTVQTTQHSLQVLKDCKVLFARPLSPAELETWQQLTQAELKMQQLQVPLDEMSQSLKPHQDKMTELSSALQLQSKRDRLPDETLLEQTRRTAERIEDITDSYQGEIDAISSFGDEISKIAQKFEQQITAKLPEGSFDQLRVVKPGENAPKDCQHGMFFTKSLQVNSINI